MRYQSFAVICFYLMQFVTLPISIAPAETVIPGKEQVTFVWESRNPPLIEAQKQFLQLRGAKVGSIKETDDSKAVSGTILLTLAVTASVCVLADALVQAVKDYEHSGIVVDVHDPDSPRIYEQSGLKRGQILILKPDGEVKYEEHSKPDASKTLCGLLVGALDVSKVFKAKRKK